MWISGRFVFLREIAAKLGLAYLVFLGDVPLGELSLFELGECLVFDPTLRYFNFRLAHILIHKSIHYFSIGGNFMVFYYQQCY